MKINNIKIKNFKSLKDIDLKFSNLTLFTGVNSSGKSSLIQGILLYKQNLDNLLFNDIIERPLSINGKYVKLGNKKEILFEGVYNEKINIEISASSILYDEKETIYMSFNSSDLHFKTNFSDYVGLLDFDDDSFQYIATNRTEPKIFYNLNDESVNENNIGTQGEFTAHYLAKNRHKIVEIEALIHRYTKTNQLLENVSLWLSEISGNIEVKAKIYDELERVTLTYSYNYGDNTTKDYTPLNVGFGITYVLPIIVSILKAKKGDLLIIENPESHLHPAGQSKVAELCAIASANGVQIIVETHSDHFLNGIRVATKKGLLTPEQSQIYYFFKEDGELETKIDKINIDKYGKIDNWTKGFFDEYDKQLDELIEW